MTPTSTPAKEPVSDERLAEKLARKLVERAGFMRDAGHDDDADLDIEAADALVDRYRAPTTGSFKFPGDVAAIVRRLDAAEAELKASGEVFEWLEKTAKESRTGISFDWVPACEGEPSGWRFMRRHFISEPHKSLRQAFASAMDFNLGRPFK